ncbi:MAG: FMN-binding negative transcriptional regulator [Algibacter sp.]|nr:FMN-binding negative transcriptional regulator [Algibacter sp.]MDG1728757.1 FMN-binding negative transcriptional regulator [Algibacter sp.]MDG2177796.1 FMN-binding negative transcriptional regulator [Algibacter sp.]
MYATKQLPTWNYLKVHLKGKVKAIESKAVLKASLIKMTEFLEAPDYKYILEPDNRSMNSYLDYIEIFEIFMDSWERKFKLS